MPVSARKERRVTPGQRVGSLMAGCPRRDRRRDDGIVSGRVRGSKHFKLECGEHRRFGFVAPSRHEASVPHLQTRKPKSKAKAAMLAALQIETSAYRHELMMVEQHMHQV